MSTSSQAQVTPERIMQFAWGYAPPLILEAAIRLRVFDVLDNGPKTLKEVQAATGVSERGLAAIMNALCGLNFLEKDQARYALTEESAAFLVTTKPSFQGGLLLHTSEQLIPRWLHLKEVVSTGKPVSAANLEESGSEFFQNFVMDIYPMSYPAAHTLAKALAVDKADGPVSVLDLAAGSAVWSIAIAQLSPQVRVTAVDWPGVMDVTRKSTARVGLADRYQFVSGDLLVADFGKNHTIATLGHILHTEGEERSKKLLAKTFEALASGGTIAIAEFLVNQERTGPPNGLIFAVNMLINSDNGGTFSFEEISSWLKEAGFVNPRTLDAPGPSPLILATKP